jgi:hypothetical protein
MAQTFGRFKLFKGSLTAIQDILNKITEFANAPNVSPRSVGVEYLEKDQQVVVSIGFAHETDDKTVGFETSVVGNINTDELIVLESKLEEEASKIAGVICHEFFIDEKGDMHVIFMKSV